MQRNATRRTTRLILTALAASFALLAAAAPRAAAAPAATSRATNTCWLQVVNDWLDHNSQIQGTYPVPCYTQAIQHLNEYPDVQNYSNATDDIHRALLAVLRQDRGGGPSSGSAVPLSPGPGSQSPGVGPTTTTTGTGLIRRLTDQIGPGNAQSIPLPLLVLGGLALLLLLAAFGTWLARRVQGRRVTAATAPATARPRRR
ncbi:MAG: hypothetical protein ACYDBR_11015 [Gaiellaceae bacterium]